MRPHQQLQREAVGLLMWSACLSPSAKARIKPPLAFRAHAVQLEIEAVWVLISHPRNELLEHATPRDGMQKVDNPLIQRTAADFPWAHLCVVEKRQEMVFGNAIDRYHPCVAGRNRPDRSPR